MWLRQHFLHLQVLQRSFGRCHFLLELRRLGRGLEMKRSFAETEGCAIALESWRQVHISRNDAPVEQRVHTVGDIVLSDRRWVGKWVIAELLGQNALS